MRSYCAFIIALIGYISPVEGSSIPLLPLQQVEAEHVDLEDKTLHLVGHVKVVHEIGVLHCDESTLLMPQEKKDGENIAVNTILLKGHVVIDFTDGSHLYANEGEIDCRVLEGTFIAYPPEKVTYTAFATDEHQRIPVRATGRTLKAKITKTPLGYSLTSMRGEGAVNIEYLRSIPLDSTDKSTKEEKSSSNTEGTHD
jgi:hypothetical protein